MRNGRRTSPETGEDVGGGAGSDAGGDCMADGRSGEMERCAVGIDGLSFSVGSSDGEM